VLAGAARPDRPDPRSLANSVTLPDGERAELNKGYRVPIGGLDRDDLSVRAHGAGEPDDTRSRREHGLAALALHVDPPVLAASVRVAAVDERLENSSRGGPRPRVGGRRNGKRGERGGDYCEATHRYPLVSKHDNVSTVAGAADVVNPDYIRETDGRAGHARARSGGRRELSHPGGLVRPRRAPPRPRQPHARGRRSPRPRQRTARARS
jgi:hypothetical protein